MRDGFILLVVILIVVVVASTAALSKFSQFPSEKTQKWAQSIFKYPNAQSWEIMSRKSICLPKVDCQQETVIYFKTHDQWPTIYGYFVTYMNGYGWHTGSEIFTTIPSNVVFSNNDNCIAVLTKAPSWFLSKLTNSKHTGNDLFKLSISCVG